MNLKATNKTETNKYELEIEVPAEDFNKAIDEVFKTEGKKITIGLPQGKAPKAFIEKYTASPCSSRPRWTDSTVRR